MREVTEWKKFKQSLKVNKPLIPLKVTMLLYYGAWSLYLPYLTLQMVQVGLTIEEIAIIYAVLPFVTFIGPPIAGLLADKFNRYKLLLISSVAMAAIFHTLLLFIDARIDNTMSVIILDNATATELTCNQTGSYIELSINDTLCGLEMNNTLLDVIFIPSECSFRCLNPRMNLCHSDNCSQVVSSSTSQLELIVDLEEIFSWNDNCTARISNVFTLDKEIPATLLCSCPLQCPIAIEKNLNPTTMSSHSPSTDNKHLRGFWAYFFLRILASGSLGTSFSMLDATAICMVKKYRGDLGKQRLFGVIGQALFAMIAGILLDWMVELKGFPDYGVVFYLGDVLLFIVIILVSRLEVDVERVEGNFKANFKKLIRLVDVDVFLVMMLFLGSCWGFLESFLFVFLMELNATSYLLGMTVTLGCIVGIPFLYISDTIVRKIGEINVIIIAYLIYCIRFFAYSFIWNAWLCLPFEALEAVTVHLMAVASSTYCAAAAPPGLLATLNGAVGSAHYSFGRGIGSFIGGTLMAAYGTRSTFQTFGTCAGILGIGYFTLHRFYLIHFERQRTRRKSEQIASAIASGIKIEDEETEEPFIIPPDNLMGRRLSCF